MHIHETVGAPPPRRSVAVLKHRTRKKEPSAQLASTTTSSDHNHSPSRNGNDIIMGVSVKPTTMSSSSNHLNHNTNTMMNEASTMSKMEVAFSKMQGSVGKYARANDRRMVLRTLKEVKHLDCIPLDPMDDSGLVARLPELEQEVSRERIILNDMPFVHKKKNGNYDFLVTLQELCYKLCEDPSMGGGGRSSLDPHYLYEQLIIRMAPTSSSADAHFKLNSLLGSPDLMLMPCQPHFPANIGTSTAVTAATKLHQEPLPPIQLQVFASGGQIHATISTAHGFGLYRKVDVKPDGGRPWIYLQALTRERVNFNNHASVRTMRLKLPNELY